MTDRKTVLITGTNGKFGRHSRIAFEEAGWNIRTFDRRRDDLDTAARGVDAIVMGMHPPTYDLWDKELLPLHDRVIAAARRADVPVVVPGNLYAFGPGSGPRIDETTPRRAQNPLGRLRREMEARYRDSGVQTILLLCGDFIDDRASGNWFDRFIMAGAWRGRMRYPGAMEAPHAWCWLPDAARIGAQLADRAATLPRFAVVPVPGLTLTGRELGEAVSAEVGRPVTVKPFAWWPLRLARPFVPVLTGVFEMRYLWSMPHSLDGTALRRYLPDFRPTPVAEVMARALAPLAPGR